jgi:hypothetical protein
MGGQKFQFILAFTFLKQLLSTQIEYSSIYNDSIYFKYSVS